MLHDLDLRGRKVFLARMMRRTLGLLNLVLLCIAPGMAGAQNAPVPARALAQINAVDAGWIAALEAGDLDRAFAGFAPDAVFISAPGVVTKGTAAEMALFQQGLAAGIHIVSGKEVVLGVGMVGSSIVAREAIFLKIKDGAGRQFATGHYTLTVWAKAPNGTWMISRSIELPGAPKPAPAL